METDITAARETAAHEVWAVYRQLVTRHAAGDLEGIQDLQDEVCEHLNTFAQLQYRELADWENDNEQAWRCIERYAQDVTKPGVLPDWMETAAELVAVYPDLGRFTGAN